jgi:hypothetical protein
MCSMQPDFDVDLIIKRQVGQVGENVTDHDGKWSVRLEEFKHDLDDVQVLEFHKDVLIFVGEALHADKNTHDGVLV